MIKYQTIRIPHLDYTIRIIRWKRDPDNPDYGAICRRIDNFCSVIELKPNATAGTVAHEVMHAVRHICYSRGMTIEYENEHLAYLVGWLVGKIRGERDDC